MTPKAPNAAQESQTPLPYTPVMGPDRLTWRYTVAGNGSLTGMTTHLWIRVTQPLVNLAVAGVDCTWSMGILKDSPRGSVSAPAGCIVDPPGSIPAGDRELVFTPSFNFNAEQARLEPGDVVQLDAYRQAAGQAQGGDVLVLAGTAQFDSRIEFAQLDEPVP
jgi:hypothetical protein